MNTVNLVRYGAVLTGREFGKDVFLSLKREFKFPLVLDFAGVEAVGSSFGDEVVPKVAAEQGNVIKILNANEDVRATLKDIEHDSGIKVEIE